MDCLTVEYISLFSRRRQDLGKCIWREVSVLIFSTTFVWIFYISLKHWTKSYHKCIYVFLQLPKFEFCQLILVQARNSALPLQSVDKVYVRFDMARDRNRWRAVVRAILDRPRICKLLRKDSVPWSWEIPFRGYGIFSMLKERRQKANIRSANPPKRYTL